MVRRNQMKIQLGKVLSFLQIASLYVGQLMAEKDSRVFGEFEGKNECAISLLYQKIDLCM